jgi:hypothetical protein
MFNLKTGIHFHEIELVIGSVKDEFYSTSIHISNSSGCFNGSFTDLSTNILGNLGRGFFNDLLVTTLYRAITFIQVNIVAMTITENLELNVTRFLDIFFNDNMLIVETLESLSLGCI